MQVQGLIAAGALWVALLLDLALGEPAVRWHPVVWMGRYLGWIGRRVAPVAGDARASAACDLRGFVGGGIAWCVGAAFVVAIAAVLAMLLRRLPWWAAMLLTGIALKPLLAWRLLRDEVRAVEGALGDSLAQGRAQLGWLVSREVSGLSEVEVRESAIESLAENLNDSLVAPLFWFALLGLPGAALYRFANTADAMWGYRGERDGRQWEWAGKWAARADDLLSWLPARLTAGLLLCCGRAGRGRAGLLAATRREAARTPSPNSGWPMAAMALQLDVRLAKPGVYALNAGGGRASAADTVRALVLAARAVLLAGCGAALLAGGLAARIGVSGLAGLPWQA